jgi:hypothetical protein
MEASRSNPTEVLYNGEKSNVVMTVFSLEAIRLNLKTFANRPKASGSSLRQLLGQKMGIAGRISRPAR